MPGYLERTVTIKRVEVDPDGTKLPVLPDTTSKINAGWKREELLDHCAQLFRYVRPTKIYAHRADGVREEIKDPGFDIYDEGNCTGALTDLCYDHAAGKDVYLVAEWNLN